MNPSNTWMILFTARLRYIRIAAMNKYPVQRRSPRKREDLQIFFSVYRAFWGSFWSPNTMNMHGFECLAELAASGGLPTSLQLHP